MKNIVKENPIDIGLVIGLLVLLIWGGLIALFIEMSIREFLINKHDKSELPLIDPETRKVDFNKSPTDLPIRSLYNLNAVNRFQRKEDESVYEAANQLTKFNKIEEVINPFFDPEGVINDYEGQLDNEEYNKWNEKAGENLHNLFSQDFDNQSINSLISFDRYRKDSQVSVSSDE